MCKWYCFHRQSTITTTVKDKNNLLSHNNWSGTDYLKRPSTGYVADGLTIESSNDPSTNGEYCYKITNSKSGGVNFILENIPDSFLNGTTYTVNADFFVNNTRSVLFVQGIKNDSTTTAISINVPKNNALTPITSTFTLTSDYTSLRIAIMLVDEGITYMDNFNLIKN